MFRILCLVLFLLSWASGVFAEAPDGARTQLNFGVISLNHPLDMYRNYLPFADFVSEKTGIEIQLVLARDYTTVVEYLAERKIDIALLAGVTYLDAQKATDIVPLCAILSRDGTPTTRTVFIVRDDRGDITSLSDIKGKRLALGSPQSTSSCLEPLYFLRENGFTPDDFPALDNLSTHEAVARAVLRGTYDAGAMSEVIYQRFAAAGLKVIAVTESYPGFLIVASEALSPEVRQRLQDVLLHLDYSSPEVEAASREWSPLLRNGFGPASDADYDVIRRHVDAMRQSGCR